MRRTRSLLVGFFAAAIFALVAAILLRVMPQPLKPSDALVVGAVATMAALVVLFIGYMISTGQRDILFKRRPKK